MARSKKEEDVVAVPSVTVDETPTVDTKLVEKLKKELEYKEHKIANLESELVSVNSLMEDLKSKSRASDNTVTVDGVEYRVVYKHVTKEFFEDIKRRIVPEEALCLALLPA